MYNEDLDRFTQWHPELTDDLKTAKLIEAIYKVSGIGPALDRRNGEGDRYYTDGEIKIFRLVAGCKAKAGTTVELDNLPLVNMKNVAWKTIAAILVTSQHADKSK